MHNKVAIKSLRFVLNREILMFRQTFLESTQKFAKKCPLYRGRGCTRLARNHFSVWKELKVWQNRKLALRVMQKKCSSQKIYNRIPAFRPKNVRYKVRG